MDDPSINVVWLGTLKFPHLQVVIGSLHPHSPPCLCLSCLFTSTETTIEADHVWKDPPKSQATLGQLGNSYRFPVVFNTYDQGRWFNTKPILQDKSIKFRFARGLYFPKSAARVTGVGSLFLTKPNNAMFKWEMPEHYHGFALFDPPKMGKLMNPGLSNEWIERTKLITDTTRKQQSLQLGSVIGLIFS